MRTKVDGDDVSIEIFRDMNSFLNANNEREYTGKAGGEDKFCSCDEWRGGFKTIEEVEDCARHGWESPLAELKGAFNLIKPNCKSFKSKSFADVVGYSPIVPNAIRGLPNSMINQGKKINNKVITVIYNSSISWSVRAKDLIAGGKKIAIGVKELEMKGYRVELFTSFIAEKNGKYASCFVRIKESNQPLDIKKICFPLINPAMLRVMFFEWADKSPDAYPMGGSLGCPAPSRFGSNVCRQLINKNCAYVGYKEILEAESFTDLIFDPKTGKVRRE